MKQEQTFTKPSQSLAESMSKDEIKALLYNLIGYPYHITARTDKESGRTVYEIIGLSIEERFSSWYYVHRAEHQTFETMADAALQFIRHWMEWKSIGEPEPW